MAATRTLAEWCHVAGPPEKEPDDSAAGWLWTQRCLRCDRTVASATWWPLGFLVHELEDGKMTTELPPDIEPGPKCRPLDA